MFRSFSNISAKLDEILSTSQRKTYFIAFATVVFVIVVTLAGILPAFSTLTFQGEENARRQDGINKIKAKLEDAKKLSTEYNQNPNLVNYFNLIFPNNIDQQYLITKINDLVNQNNSYLSSINFSGGPSSTFQKLEISKEVDSLTLSIFIEGNLTDLQNILKAFEESRRIFNLTSLFFENKDIERQQQEAFERGNAILNLQAEVYFFKSNLPIE